MGAEVVWVPVLVNYLLGGHSCSQVSRVLLVVSRVGVASWAPSSARPLGDLEGHSVLT